MTILWLKFLPAQILATMDMPSDERHDRGAALISEIFISSLEQI